MAVQDDDGDIDDFGLAFGDGNDRSEIISGTDPVSQRLRFLSDQNPWHHSGSVPTTLAPQTERPLARILWRKMLDDGLLRWHIVLGPRRVGKTTVLYQTVAHLLDAGIERHRIWWLRLDHPLLVDVALADVVRSVIASVPDVSPERPIFLFLDEVTYADDWDLWLKTFHDERWPVRIAATSSASAALRKRRQDSGVGRWREISLAPCLVSEAMQLVATPPQQPQHEVPLGTSLADQLHRLEEGTTSSLASSEAARLLMLVGGFPELLLHAGQARVPPEYGPLADDSPFTEALVAAQLSLREDAVERAVYKDIPQAFQIDNPMMLERLLYVLAGQVAQLLSSSNIAADLRLAEATVERYLAYLEAAFIVFTLPNYAGSEAARSISWTAPCEAQCCSAASRRCGTRANPGISSRTWPHPRCIRWRPKRGCGSITGASEATRWIWCTTICARRSPLRSHHRLCMTCPGSGR